MDVGIRRRARAHDCGMTSYADAQLQPLETDALIQHRVTELIGGACRRQLWFLFLDEHGVQLPVLMPIADPPLMPPPPESDVLLAMVGHLVEAVEASAIVLVVERPGGEEVSASDRAWAGALHAACHGVGVPLRALLLSHDHGVRWLAQDDYRY
jgi:hypothetical protein